MSKTASRGNRPLRCGPFTALLCHCIECGCDDMNACFDIEANDACHWLDVDREAGKGVCSACPDAMRRWRRGQRGFAVPVDLAANQRTVL